MKIASTLGWIAIVLAVLLMLFSGVVVLFKLFSRPLLM